MTSCTCNEGLDYLGYEGNEVEVKSPGYNYEKSEKTESYEERWYNTFENNSEC